MRQLSTAETVLGSPVRNVVSVLAFVLAVIVLSTIGYMKAGWSFGDAIYMVLLTVYTVGYGEVRPINTPYLHSLTIGTMVLGCTGIILLTGALVQLFTVIQIRQILDTNRMKNDIDHLSGHAIICGYGRIGVMLARDLAAAGTPLVVIERRPERLAEAEAAGHLCLAGDATDEEALTAAHIDRARVLATVLPDDAANVFITLGARKLSPGIRIIARGEVPTTESKLRHAGADQVVLPAHIGAERIAHMILHPESAGLDRDEELARVGRGFAELGLGFERLIVEDASEMAGLTVAEAERRGQGAFFLVRIERDSEGVLRPSRDARLVAGDRVLLVARGDSAAIKAMFAKRERVRAGRTLF